MAKPRKGGQKRKAAVQIGICRDCGVTVEPGRAFWCDACWEKVLEDVQAARAKGPGPTWWTNHGKGATP